MRAANFGFLLSRHRVATLIVFLMAGLTCATSSAHADQVNWGLPDNWVDRSPYEAGAQAAAARRADGDSEPTVESNTVADAAAPQAPMTPTASGEMPPAPAVAETPTTDHAPVVDLQPVPQAVEVKTVPQTVAANADATVAVQASPTSPPHDPAPIPVNASTLDPKTSSQAAVSKPKMVKNADDQYVFSDNAKLDARHELPMQMTPVDPGAITPEMARVWAENLQQLEKENQVLRAKLGMTGTDPLSDIKVDVVEKIREDVLRARVIELEKELDKLHMDHGSDGLPEKSGSLKNDSAKPDATKATPKLP